MTRKIKLKRSLGGTASLLLLQGILLSTNIMAQTINFSVHVASSLSASKDADMTFPGVYPGDGLVNIGLGDGGMGVFSITGNEELDVEVILTVPDSLVHQSFPNSKMGLTLQFAYANKGANDINQAIVASGHTARFQLKERVSGPAGAPPTPPNASHTPNIVTAYIYMFGSIYAGNIASGVYTGNVDLSVNYY